MNRKYLLACSFAAAVAALPAACSQKFSSCDDRAACTAAHAGSSGNADSGRDQEQDGNSGKSGGGGAGNAGGDAGESGSGGEGGADDSPTLFGACSSKGALACEHSASAQRLACDGHHWMAGTTCPADHFCDSSDGSCEMAVTECVSATPGTVVCRGDRLLTCGPDLVTASEGETCAGRCKAGVCQAPSCGDEKVEVGEDCDNDDKRNPGDGCSATCHAEAIALALGGNTTCALSSTGVVKCWGFNGSGELGLGHTENRGDSIVPRQSDAVDLGVGRKAKAISVSAKGSACALLDGGDLKCWGNNQFGQLGTGDLTNRGDKPNQMGNALKPIALGAGRKAISVSAGADYTCAVLDDGSVKCWGSNGYGRLGTENSASLQAPDPMAAVKLGRKAKAVSASADGVTCALLDDGTLRCWGNIWFATHSDYAELGGDPGIGDFAGEISGLPPLTFSGASPVQTLVAGRVSAVILGDGSLRLWGNSSDAQLGPGAVYLGLTPTELAAVPPVEIGIGQTAKAIALGAAHACALLNGGVVKCWGDNSAGQLGLGNADATNATPSAMDAVYLGGQRALQIAAGQSHSCAILDNGTIKCWGANSVGQLGLGDVQSRGDSGGKLSANTTVDLVF
ncbi:MAG TPA: hypothetical protein VER96_31515 [Polyangiaceae bacterium]|nr:hypothetical protein [Polyangiaceae bacterium]